MVSYVFPLAALTLSPLWKEMKIVEKEGGMPVFDTFLNAFFCQLPKLTPGSRVKLAKIYPSRSG